MAFALRTARTVAARAAPRRAARCARSFCAPAASPKVQQLCDDVCQLNVLELNEFLQLFKEKAGLSDADLQGGGGGGGVMMAPAAAIETFRSLFVFGSGLSRSRIFSL